MQIVADESVDFGIVAQLRLAGHEVYSIAESSTSIADEEVLKIAHDKRALLITEDKDFGDLVFRFQLPHSGILLIKISDPSVKISNVVNAIITHYNELLGKFSVIDSRKIRIRE